jgi:hypothetical protein
MDAHMALATADRAYVLETGKVALFGAAQELARDPRVQQAYPGDGGTRDGRLRRDPAGILRDRWALLLMATIVRGGCPRMRQGAARKRRTTR